MGGLVNTNYFPFSDPNKLDESSGEFRFAALSSSARFQLESLILAQNERWRRA